MTTLGIPLNLVICSQTDPLWQWPILAHLLGQSTLRTKSLLGWLQIKIRGGYDGYKTWMR